MQNNHSDVPLLKFQKSDYQIKSYVEKSELVYVSFETTIELSKKSGICVVENTLDS